MKTLYFVSHPADIPVLRRHSRLSGGGGSVWVAVDGALAARMRRAGESCRSFAEFDVGEGEEIRRLALEWLDARAEEKLFSGRSFKDFFRCRGATVWSFALPLLFADVLRCVQLVVGARRVLEAERPDRVVLVDVRRRPPHPFRLNLDAELPGKIIAESCRGRVEVEWVWPAVVTALQGTLRRWRARFLEKAYYAGGRRLLGTYRAWLTRGRPSKGGAGCVLVLSSPIYWREGLGPDGRWGRDDAIAGSCIGQWAARGYRVVGLDFELNTPGRGQFAVLREKRRRPDIDWRAYETYRGRLDQRALRQDRREAAQLGRAWDSEAGPGFLVFDGVDLGPFLDHRLHFFFKRSLPEALEYRRAIEAAIAAERPSLMVSVYEEGPYGRAATLAGREHGVPTLALQHGILSSPYVPAYYFKRVSSGADPDPGQVPVPDCTAVYGEQTRQWLTGISAYPPAAVETVGMPAADAGIRDGERLALESRRDLGIEPGAPLVLVVSQPFLNREDRAYFVENALRAAAQMPDAQWVVKLHPRDPADAWTADLKAAGLAQRVMVADGRLLGLVHACDVLLSWYSTVILEAAVCRKPVVVLKVPGCRAPEDLVRDGLAVAVEGYDGVVAELRRQLADPRPAAAAALQRHVYCPDGGAASRVADLGERLIRERGGRPQAAACAPA